MSEGVWLGLLHEKCLFPGNEGGSVVNERMNGCGNERMNERGKKRMNDCVNERKNERMKNN